MSNEPRFSKVQELVHELKVSDAMSPNVVTVKPESLMSELRRILRTRRISGTPVVDGDRLVGIISIEDFVKWLADGAEECPIRDKMTTGIKTLYADEPLVLAVGRFEQSGFGRFPVLDRKDGRLVGMLTKGDIIKSVLQKLEVDYQEEEIHRHRANRLFEDITADKVALVFRSRVKGKDFNRAGQVSSSLRKALRHLNVHPHVVRRASIASYEAEMNLVIYTEGGEITVEVRPAAIRIDVRDLGPGIPDVRQALESGYSTAPDWVRELGFGAGMGLNNIQNCADRLKVTSSASKGTHLRIGIDMETAGNGQDVPRTRKR